jgi:hypothetical protein
MSGTVHEGKPLLCRASKLDRDLCPQPSRKIPRDIHEHVRDVARLSAGTEGIERATRAQEDRDALRTPEAHPEAWSTSTARPSGCIRRLHARRHPENLRRLAKSVCPAATVCDPGHRVAGSCLRASGPDPTGRQPNRQRRLLQQNLPIADIENAEHRLELKKEVAQRRLSSSNVMIADQAAINAGFRR